MKKINPIGSETFGTNIISTNECLLFAENMFNNKISVPIISARITAIDNMLTLQKMASLNNLFSYTRKGKRRKNTSFDEGIDMILDRLVDTEKAINNIK